MFKFIAQDIEKYRTVSSNNNNNKKKMQLHCKQTHDEVYREQAYKKTTLKQH